MKDPGFAKLVVFINSLIPLAMLVWDVSQGQAGANPKEYAIHTTGFLAILFLVLSLAITPLRLISGANWLSHFRRMLGLFAFFYACTHLGTYYVWDRGLNFASLIDEAIKRPFIYFGMGALILMIPLAITSTNGMIKRIGGKNWKNLHMLVYPAAILAMTHYWLASKLVGTTQKTMLAVLILLLGYRVAVRFFPALRYRRSPAATAVE